MPTLDERMLRAVFADATDAIVIANLHSEIEAVNPALELMFGYEAGELVGRRTDVLYADGGEKAHGAARQPLRHATGSRPVEIRYRRRNGEVFDAETVARPIRGEDERPIGLVGVIRDVSRTTRFYETLRGILTTTVAAGLSLAERLQWLLQHACDYLNLDTGIASRIDGASYRIEALVGGSGLTPGRVLALDETCCAAVVESGGLVALDAVRGSERLPHAAYGQAGVAAYIGAPVRVASCFHGTVCFYSGTARDRVFSRDDMAVVELIGQWVGQQLTDEHHARALQEANARLAASERRLRAKNDELARSNSDLEQFARIASHDLREPLRKIRTFIGHLAHDLPDRLSDDNRFQMEVIEASAERLDRLIQDLLVLSRTGRSAVREPVDMGEVLDELREDFALALQEAGGVLEAEPLPVIEADRVLVRLLLQNLIGNAIKYRSAGRPLHVRVTSRREADRLLIGVSDNGIGFEPRHAERIFAPFQRLHRQSEYQGTGIGLAICDKIAKRYGGSIAAKGEPDRGADFVVALPAGRLTGEGGGG